MPTLEWVKGFFDRSAHISRDYPAITATTSSQHLAYAVAGVLKHEGIKHTIRCYRQRYTVRISGLEALKWWHDEIRFTDPRQQKQLSEVIRDAESDAVWGASSATEAPSP